MRFMLVRRASIVFWTLFCVSFVLFQNNGVHHMAMAAEQEEEEAAVVQKEEAEVRKEEVVAQKEDDDAGNEAKPAEPQQLQEEDVDILSSTILGDMFPKTSSRCKTYSDFQNKKKSDEDGKKHYTFEYESSAEASGWDKQHAVPFEKDLFLLEMRHSSDAEVEPEKAWTMRVGQAGNIYSFRGAYGEAMPPQNHPGAPWIDEVWQTVSVNQEKNRQPGAPRFFIHQAGTYMKDDPYTTRQVFYSPTLARHCSAAEHQCSVASWGQQAHVPTPHTSEALYWNRYRDCGDGVVEVTYMVYNNADPGRGKWGKLNYFNVPWAGVRTSNLDDLFLSEKQTGRLRWQFPVPGFGYPEEPIPNVSSTGGFTTFSSSSNNDQSEATAKAATTKAPTFSLDDVDDTFYMPVVDSKGNLLPRHEAKAKHEDLANKRRHHEVTETQKTAAAAAASNDTCTDTEATTTTTVHDPNILRLVLKTNRACRDSRPRTKMNDGDQVVYCDIEKTFELKSGEKLAPLVFTNPRTGVKLRVRNVLHWAYGGTQLYFEPEPQQSVDSRGAFVTLMNDSFDQGDEIVVSYDVEHHPLLRQDGTAAGRHNALTFVHGDDAKGTRNRDTPTRLRYGRVAGKRDYTVFTVNLRKNIVQGHTLVDRQYLISGKLADASAQGRKWLKEHHQDVLAPGGSTSTTTNQHKINHKIMIYSFPDRDGVFGARVLGRNECTGQRKLVCEGNSTPQLGHRAFFAVRCGDEYYFGPNQYYFTNMDEKDGTKRSYVCHSSKTQKRSSFTSLLSGGSLSSSMSNQERPEWKLMGFYDPNDCEEVRNMKYDPYSCSDKDVIQPGVVQTMASMNPGEIVEDLTAKVKNQIDDQVETVISSCTIL